jgi:hypothetical protein
MYSPPATTAIAGSVDRVFDALLTRLGCTGGRDANLISHWQDGIGYRIQVTRKSDGASLTKLVDLQGAVRP